MEDASCAMCGDTYTRKRHDQRFCSAACRYRHRDTVESPDRAQARRDRWRDRNSHTCPVCGDSAGHNSTTCGSPICQATVQGRDRSTWPRSPICTPITPLVCACCERTFTKRPGMHDGAYCSVRCRHIAKGWMPTVSVLSFGSCLRCASTFVRRKGWAGQYCSERCSDRSHNHRRKARKRASRSDGERFTIRQVAERDGWRCHLCGRRVPDQVWSGHPLDATVDHLLPLSAGGGDTLANVKLAHFKCNTRRGVGGVVQLTMV